MNKYNNFTVEETNLLSIYMTGSKEGLVVNLIHRESHFYMMLVGFAIELIE